MIGDPAHITAPDMTTSNNFVIKFPSSVYSEWTCETGTTTKTYYNFDPYRGICYRFKGLDTPAAVDDIEIMHIFGQSYDLSKLDNL